jgi:hypothetical protein
MQADISKNKIYEKAMANFKGVGASTLIIAVTGI